MAENNILDKLRSEHADEGFSKISKAMEKLLEKVLNGATSVLKAAINKEVENAILFIAMEDMEIDGYPIQFLLGLQEYENKNIEVYCKSGLSIIREYMTNLDKRIKTDLRKIEDYLIIEINWEETKVSESQSSVETKEQKQNFTD